jgi:SAM-dependent methyltransferase
MAARARGEWRDPPSSGFARTLGPRPLALEQATVTKILYGRLSAADVAGTEQLIRDTPGAWEHYFGGAERAANHDLLLALGMWLGSELLSERTGLIRAEPPEDVHAMTRGAQNAAGGLYEANLVIDALLGAGGEMSRVAAALDFGCSSGRVVKPLAAAYPDVSWRGCDPNEPAVAWARANLPGIEFFANGSLPPLPLADGELDLAYAISIWSHFKPSRGELWLAEMHRVLAPGGHLVMTTHGPTSVGHDSASGQRSARQSREILDALYRQGWWYAAEFGAAGDWGVVDPEWGTAFVSPEWVLTQLCPRWRVLEYAPGRNQDNQDVYVMQRV